MIYNVQVEFQKDFIRAEDDLIKVGIKSKPVKGKANEEIVKKISRHFRVSSANVRIKTGHKSKEKIVEILS